MLTASPEKTPAIQMAVDRRLKRAFEKRTLPRDLLCCGAAGTGKTWGILRFIHYLARTYKNLRILLCRATRAALTESVLVTFEQEILPLGGFEYIAGNCQRRVRQSYRYPSGTEIVCGSLDNPSKILSTAWDVAFINEAIEATEDAWEMLASRMSRPGRDNRFGYLIGDTNPGHPTHWLKVRCDRGDTKLWDTRHEANPAMFKRGDWTPAGKVYLKSLDHLTGTRRKRLRDGLWAVGEGLWFDSFDPDIHVREDAEFDTKLPVILAVDSGVFTGAVWMQRRDADSGPVVTVFADYLSEGLPAHANAQAIQAVTAARCPNARIKTWTDPAGGAKNPVGPSVLAEYERAGLKLDNWPVRAVAEGLTLVEAFVGGTLNTPPAAIFVHPRCTQLINAFSGYRRAKRADQFMDYPEDPQHPYEDVMDALRGGLVATFPDGRRPASKLPRVRPGQVI